MEVRTANRTERRWKAETAKGKTLKKEDRDGEEGEEEGSSDGDGRGDEVEGSDIKREEEEADRIEVNVSSVELKYAFEGMQSRDVA